MSENSIEPLLRRLAEALERIAPPEQETMPLSTADGFVWHAEGEYLEPVPQINRVALELLKGIDQALVLDLLHQRLSPISLILLG